MKENIRKIYLDVLDVNKEAAEYIKTLVETNGHYSESAGSLNELFVWNMHNNRKYLWRDIHFTINELHRTNELRSRGIW